MKKKNIISILLVVTIFFTSNLLQFSNIHAGSGGTIHVSMGSPAIPLTKGESVSLEDIRIEFTYSLSFKASDVNLTVEGEGIKIADGKITALKEGVYKVNAEKNNTTKVVYAVVRENNNDDFVLFFDDFNSELSEEYRRIEGLPSDVTVEEGFLLLRGTATTSTRLLLPAFLDDFGNYEIEVVGTIATANEPTRWGSIMFRSQEGNNQYLQMCIRQNATAANGLEIAENTGGWTVHKTASYKEKINPEKMYTFKVIVDESNIDCFINNEQKLSAELDSYLHGSIGFQANNSTLKIDSVTVKAVEGKPSKTVHMFAEIAQPDMDIIGGMGFSEVAESQDDIDRINGLEIKPSNVIFYLDKDLNVTDKNYQNPYMNLEEAVNTLMGVIMPTFNINDEETAENLATYLKENKLEDVFVMSSNPELVYTVRRKAKISRGVIDFTDKYKDKDSITKEELMEIRGIVNSNLSSIAVIPSSIATRDNVKYLYDRLVAVWVNETNSLEGKINAYNLLITGAHGIISNNTELLYDTTKLMSGKKLLRVPLNVGHRGVPSLAPENTIEGGLLAYENGADVIEIDVYLTKDGVPVIIHDANTARTCNGVSLEIRNSTVEQLKELNANSGRSEFEHCEIPTLEEFYVAIKDLDVQVFVELKSTEKALITQLREITQRHNMTERISVITFHTANISTMTREFSEMSVGYLMGAAATGATSNMQTRSVLNLIQPYGTTYNPSYAHHSPEFFTRANMRGLTTWPWTINNEMVISYFLAGANGITTDTCQVLAPFTKFLNADNSEYEATAGKTHNVEATRITYGREEIDASKDVKVIILEGEDNVTVKGGTLTFGKNPGKVVYALEYTHKIDDINSYAVYSEPVTVTIVSASYIALIVIIAIGVLVVGGLFITLFFFRRNKKK